MLFGNQKLYTAARDAKLGATSLSQTREQLRISIGEQYSISVRHIVYDQIGIGPHPGRPRLNIIVDTAADYGVVHKDQFTPKRNVQDTIRRCFEKVVRENSADYDTENVHVVFDDFSAEAMGHAARQFRDSHSDDVVRQFRDAYVWTITGMDMHSIVFYLRDSDISTNDKNGSSRAIIKQCFDLIQAYDEFGYFMLSTFPITFDSKQRFDREYNSSWFYYFR